MNEEQNAIGFLTVQTLTANGALPVRNATVRVYAYGEEFKKEDPLYFLKTDRSGRTDTVALSARPAKESLTPGSKKPYAAYSLTVNAEGYYESERINVPVFQGVSSLQTINLIPLSEYSDSYSKTPESLNRYNDIPSTSI